MIYVTLTTRNRFWHSALSALAIANANWHGCFLHVLDDASDDIFADAKEFLFRDLLLRDVIHRYERFPERRGFCAGREYLANAFLGQPRFTHWVHLDDDILLGEQTAQRAVLDLDGPLKREGILHLYVNPWSKWQAREGHFGVVSAIGGACFAIHRTTLETIGNPYRNQTNGEKANAHFWKQLQRHQMPMHIRWTDCYACQHTGNTESVIFGDTPSWEHLYAKDFKTNRIIDVPPFHTPELRSAINNKRLPRYAWQMNAACRNRIKLPPPGSRTGISQPLFAKN